MHVYTSKATAQPSHRELYRVTDPEQKQTDPVSPNLPINFLIKSNGPRSGLHRTFLTALPVKVVFSPTISLLNSPFGRNRPFFE